MFVTLLAAMTLSQDVNMASFGRLSHCNHRKQREKKKNSAIRPDGIAASKTCFYFRHRFVSLCKWDAYVCMYVRVYVYGDISIHRILTNEREYP